MLEAGPHLQLQVHRGEHSAVATSRLVARGRESILVNFFWQHERFVGEAAPLMGFGGDSFQSAHDALSALDGETLGRVLDSCPLPNPCPGIFEFSAGIQSPSARFAVETCMLGAAALRTGEPIHALLRRALGRREEAPPLLPVSALIDPLDPDFAKLAETAWLRGASALKLKVGRQFDDELLAFRTLAQRAPADLALRLDPNQSWSDLEIEQCLAVPEIARLQFLEDPSEDPRIWQEFGARLPLAVDELLVGVVPTPMFLRELEAKYVVLKPMALGGFGESLEWAKAAQAAGMGVSVSHLLDGPVALDAAVELAFAVQSEGLAPGLGLHAGLGAFRETKSRWAEEDCLIRPTPRNGRHAGTPR